MHLVDDSTFFGLPGTPLLPVDRAEISPLARECFIIFDAIDKYEECRVPLWTISWELRIFACFFQILRKCPLIPDFDIILYEISDIRISGDEPYELVDDTLYEDLFRRQERKSSREVESYLMTEYRPRPHTSAIHTVYAGIEDFLEKIEILLLWMSHGMR